MREHEVGAALEQLVGAPAVAHGEQRDRQRHERSRARRRARCRGRCARPRPGARRRSGRRAPPRGSSRRWRRRARRAPARRARAKPSSTAGVARPSRCGATTRCASGPVRLTAPAPPRQPVAAEDEQAEEDEHERERGGRGHVEGDVELGEDLGREGLVAEDLEGAVLGEQDERDEQAAAEDRASGLAERDPPERLQAPRRRGCARPPPGRGRRCGSWPRPAGRRAGRPPASSRAPRRGSPGPRC